MKHTKRVSKGFHDILKLEIDRNYIIKESAIRDYQFSDDEEFENAVAATNIKLGIAVLLDLREAHKNG